jgi:hypothetical protein
MTSTALYLTALNTMKNTKPGTPEHTEAWQAAERAKNTNGGMPPVGHTPGPWDVYAGTMIEREGMLLATVPESSQMCPPDGRDMFWETRANARLIAAAPELLEALEDCVESLSRLRNADGAYRVTCLQQVRAAIAKAKGKATR